MHLMYRSLIIKGADDWSSGLSIKKFFRLVESTSLFLSLTLRL